MSESGPVESAGSSPLAYDALLLVSFGGPEKSDDVLPFLESVAAGKPIPRERLLDVAKHYELFGGVSPLNMQNRALLAALVAELNLAGPPLAVYWGNRHGNPHLVDTVREMAEAGVRRALALVTSAFGSYSGCRQYREDIQRAREAVGPDAPVIDKLRLFYNHPGFIEAMADRVAAAIGSLSAEQRDEARLIYTAHSLPLAMALGGPYQEQLQEACRLVSERVGRTTWDLVYQSRSGPPSQAWLGPDIAERLFALRDAGQTRAVVLVPIGFLSEHMEVVFDLDVEIAGLCELLGLSMVRSGVVGAHPRFVAMIRELILERIEPHSVRLALGSRGPSPDECPANCCPPGTRSPTTGS